MSAAARGRFIKPSVPAKIASITRLPSVGSSSPCPLCYDLCDLCANPFVGLCFLNRTRQVGLRGGETLAIRCTAAIDGTNTQLFCARRAGIEHPFAFIP